MSAQQKVLTEVELIKRLRTHYGAVSGNGAEFAFVPKVRSAAAFDSRRTIDAYAMNLWPSRGLSLTAFEIKSSRSDWQRELKNPAKAEEFCERADYFYLVVGDATIVRAGELPETWGLIVPRGNGLKIKVLAPRLRNTEPTNDLPPAFDRSFLAALLRAASAVGAATPEAIAEAEERVRESERANREREIAAYRDTAERLTKERREFEQAVGLPLIGGWPHHTPAEVGAAVKLVLYGGHDIEVHRDQLRSIRSSAQALIKRVDRQLGEKDA